MTANAIVAGLGSIGTRHVRVLSDLGVSVATVSRRGGGDYRSITEAVARTSPTYAVIATETARHAESLQELAAAGFRGTVLVEKPILANADLLPNLPFSNIFVGYNLRFHPVMSVLAAKLRGHSAISVSAYAGQDIRDWRPGRDHRKTASSTTEAGGGVLRDLSHELDYLLWLFGPWYRVAALGGPSGARDIEVDDHIDLLIEMQGARTVHVHLDYLDRPGIRKIRVNLPNDTIEADLFNGRMVVNGAVEAHRSEKDESYRAMHLAALKAAEPVCSLSEGLAVMKLIDASERAMQTRVWISA